MQAHKDALVQEWKQAREAAKEAGRRAEPAAELHLGPALTEAERRYLSCDATFETWFERDGEVIGAARSTRKIPRRLRRALERRDRCCQVPGCDATAGLHAHHIVHWEDGGPTELWNLRFRQHTRCRRLSYGVAFSV